MNKCKKCGNKKMWVFIGGPRGRQEGGSFRVCDCEVNLDGAMLMPRGLSPCLDKRIDWIGEVIK